MNAVSQCFHLVIQKEDINNNKDIQLEDIKNYLENNEVIKFYAFILHDKDTNDNGELKTPHYHIVIYLTRAFAKNTIIMDIVKSMSINKLIVSCRVGDIVESTIYLTHSESKTKYHYSSLDIVTNDIYNLNSILSHQTCLYILSIDYLIELVIKSDSLSQVYSVLGLKDAKLYRAIITDLWRDKQAGSLKNYVI